MDKIEGRRYRAREKDSDPGTQSAKGKGESKVKTMPVRLRCPNTPYVGEAGGKKGRSAEIHSYRGYPGTCHSQGERQNRDC